MNLGQRISNYYLKLNKKIQIAKDRLLFGTPSSGVRKNTLLLLKLDSIGDYVLFRNFIELLKTSAKYKDYEITLCGNSWWRNLSESLDKRFIKTFIWVDYNKMNDAAYRRQLFKRIHSAGFEVLIHPTYSRDQLSDSIVGHSGALYKIGWDGDLINLTITQKQENNKNYTTLITSPVLFEFEYFRNVYFFEKLLGSPIVLQKPYIPSAYQATNKVVICPGAKVMARQWSPIKFAELCNSLKTDYPDSEFVICGSKQDTILAEEIKANSQVQFVDYCGKLTLLEFLDVLSTASLVLSNDSGPLHMALALNKRTVCISNGNNYGRFTPYPNKMGSEGIFIYPPELLAIDSEAERLALFCREGSTLDINEIQFSAVYETLKMKWFTA